MNERKTEKLVRGLLKSQGYEDPALLTIEEQKSDNPRIRKLLKQASKSGVGGGSPEFIITSQEHNDLIIIIECKASNSRHRSPGLDKPKDYACDGALLYASYLAREYDVIAAGVSGETAATLRVNYFVHLKGHLAHYEIIPTTILGFSDIYDLYIQSPQKFNADYSALLAYSQDLNRNLHKLKVKESQRSLLISSILIALKNNAFLAGYLKHKTASNLANSLVNTVIDELRESDVPKDKIDNLAHAYSFIKTHTTLGSSAKALKDLVAEVDKKINGFTKSHNYFDTLGQFYIEFLRYANNDKGLGIVLTPPHITDLFADLADLNKDSVVIDNCCGTGGFLISAMQQMVKDCAGDSSKIHMLKRTQLFGIEAQHDIYALAISNMILQDDGKSSIVNGDCFELTEEVAQKKPNVGLLNPPYKADKDDVEELEYVLNNLSMLDNGGTCVALVPISSVVSQEGKELELKKRLMKFHTLEAVMSLPEDLFHNSKVGVVTCALVVKAHHPHKSNKKTWLGYWRDDGFLKIKGKGRVDKNDRWSITRHEWIQAYRNREVDEKKSAFVYLTPADEWCVEAYLRTDYSGLSQEVIEKELRKYLAYEIISEDA